jgi:hypothetical protein
MTYLSNYACCIKDPLARLDGVGDVQMFGAGDYSMRVWLDPEKLASRGHDRRRRGRGDPRAERPGGRRPARRAAGRRTGANSSSRSTPRAA